MGIYDRDYVRRRPTYGDSFAGGPVARWRMWSFNTWLIVINAAVFVLGALLQTSAVPMKLYDEFSEPTPADRVGVPDPFVGPRGEAIPPGGLPNAGGLFTQPLFDTQTGEPVGRRVFLMMDPLTAFGHFSTARGFFGLEVWRFITFQFLHGGLTHLLFNMLGLYFFGSLVEQQLGRRRYAAFYLMCGLCGALGYLVLNLLGAVLGVRVPGALVNLPTTPLVGASAGVFGVIVACAYIAPRQSIQLLLPPVSLTMRTFAYGYVAIAAFSLIFFPERNGGGQAAHLGGAAAGYFFIRRPHLLREFFDVFDRSGSPGRGRAARRRGGGGGGADEREIDEILDKVRDEGLGSLSDRERKRLREATEGRR